MRPFPATLLLALLPACRPAPPSAAPLAAHALTHPAAPGSRAPRLTAAAGRLLSSWLETGRGDTVALRFAAFEGGTWTAPRTVAAGPDWFVNAADVPSVTALPGGALVAHWLVRGPGEGYGVRVSRSDDGGATWSPAVTPHRDGTPTEHGFVQLFPWPDGRAGIAWLDGRKYAGAAAHDHAPDRETALHFAALAPDGTLNDETALDPRTCDCCQTTAALTPGGLVVAYRDRSADEVRDISVVRFDSGRWSAPRLVHADGWRLDGCPVNGPAVAAEGRRVVIAWFTLAQDRPRVLVAFSEDAGATFGAPVDAGEADPLGRVSVAPGGDGSALVGWMAGSAQHARLRVRRVAADGTLGDALTLADSLTGRGAGFPQMARLGDDVVLTWTAPGDDDRPRLRAALLRLAPAP